MLTGRQTERLMKFVRDRFSGSFPFNWFLDQPPTTRASANGDDNPQRSRLPQHRQRSHSPHTNSRTTARLLPFVCHHSDFLLRDKCGSGLRTDQRPMGQTTATKTRSSRHRGNALQDFPHDRTRSEVASRWFCLSTVAQPSWAFSSVVGLQTVDPLCMPASSISTLQTVSSP